MKEEYQLKAAEVMRLLGITRQTLYCYKKVGVIQTTPLPNGYFDYHDEDVYRLVTNGNKRKTYLYARVSTTKQKPDLANQIRMLKTWAFQNGYPIHGIYSDIASGISFEKRKQFFLLLEELFAYQVKAVIITYKDRLSRVGFDLFHYLFQRFGTEIIVVSEVGSLKLDSEEIFEEIIALLHCYSMKLYSRRRSQKKVELSLANNLEEKPAPIKTKPQLDSYLTPSKKSSQNSKKKSNQIKV